MTENPSGRRLWQTEGNEEDPEVVLRSVAQFFDTLMKIAVEWVPEEEPYDLPPDQRGRYRRGPQLQVLKNLTAEFRRTLTRRTSAHSREGDYFRKYGGLHRGSYQASIELRNALEYLVGLTALYKRKMLGVAKEPTDANSS